MLSGWIEPLRAKAGEFAHDLGAFALCALFFVVLALLVKGRSAIADARSAVGEIRINLIVTLLGALAVGPLVSLFMLGLIEVFKTHGLHLAPPTLWDEIGQVPTLLLAIVVGDFIGYWRHRIQHTKWLWPAHAIHHSDTRLNWLSLERMHPFDQFGSALDTVLLSALGFPFWALAGNVFVRHYYGYFIHADVPFTLGKANLILNSPAMHRWHHARDVDGSGHNFATVFSIWDRMFGTYYQPGPCEAPLGVREDMGKGAVGQYLHPLKVWGRALRPAAEPTPLPADTPAA
jgi:sterol desaturase/sphingolipid hydroxylase (fatty acid hydroxylase superfamily)